jgi:DNA-binding FrmR family transcriptional regulator
MDLPDETLDDLVRRLHKVGGQLRGIEQMLADRRDCREIITQISAAKNALEQVGFKLVAAGLRWCVENPEQSAAEGYAVSEVEKMFLKLA